MPNDVSIGEIGVTLPRLTRDYRQFQLEGRPLSVWPAFHSVRVLTAEEIKALREWEMVSQPVFARYLDVSKNLVSDWERGIKKPGGPALRLLAIVKEKGLGGISL